MKEFNKQYKLPLKNTRYSHVFDAKSNMVMEIPNDELREKVVSLINGGIVDELPIKVPVTYKPTAIFDCSEKQIITIRGWGRLAKLLDGEQVQDMIGQEIASLLNMHNGSINCILPNHH